MKIISERTTNSHYILSIFIILIAFIFDNANSIRFPDRVAQPARDQSDQQHLQTAVFALGSFWRSEAVFGCLPGVVRTTVGYSGGSKPNPEYRSFGDHAESVQVLIFALLHS
jgi:peptide-methionine (S)-S-oxide reductase